MGGGFNPLKFAILGSLLLLSSFLFAANVKIIGDTTPINEALAPYLGSADTNGVRWLQNLPNNSDEYTLENTINYFIATNPFKDNSLGVSDGIKLNVNSIQNGNGIYHFGLNLDTGLNLVQSGGTIKVTATNEDDDFAWSYGIVINDGDFIQSGNSTLIANANNGGSAIYFMDSGDIVQNDNGVIEAIAMGSSLDVRTSFGINMRSGNLTQNNNGTINAVAIGGSGNNFSARGIEVGGWLTQNSGTINADATGGSGSHTNATGINVLGNFTQSGEIKTVGTGGVGEEANSYGISVMGDFIQQGGTLTTIGVGGAENDTHGYGLFVNNKSLTLEGTTYATGLGKYGFGIAVMDSLTLKNGGVLYMMPGDGYSVRIVGASDIKGDLRLGIDFSNGNHGYFKGRGAVTISSSATLTPYLINSLNLKKGKSSGDILFLTDEAKTLGGDNIFNVQNTITLDYTTRIENNNEDYILTITRRNLLSEVLDGDAGIIAKWIEDNREEFLSDAYENEIYRKFLALYSEGDMSYGPEYVDGLFDNEIIVPKTATKRLNAISENWLNVADYALAQRLTVHNDRTELVPLIADFRDGMWITPLGTVMNIYPDEKLGRATYSGAGLNLGFAGFLNNNSSYGLGLTYVNGYYDDGNTDFGRFDTSLFAGSLGYRTNPVTDKVWVEGMGSYAQSTTDAYGAFDKSRSDAYRLSAKAGVDMETGDNWRITPALGVDYTYYDYNAPMIDAGLVKMNVEDTESLRPMAEVEAVYNTKEKTRFSMKVGYSYEAMGKGIEQEMRLVGLEDVPLSVTTEGSARHNGHLGLGINHSLSETMSFAAEYDLNVNDLMTTNNFKLNLKLLY